MNTILIKKIAAQTYLLVDKVSMFKAKIDQEALDIIIDFKNCEQNIHNGKKIDILEELRERSLISESGTKIKILNEGPYLSAIVEITRKCNLNCSHCFQKKDDETITLSDFKNLANFLEEMGVLDVCLTGGEIFFLDDIWDYLAECYYRQFRLSIISNGTLLGEDEAKKISESGVSSLTISIDGSPFMHDSIRGKGSFNRTIGGIKVLLKYGLNIYINSTMLPQNFETRKFLEKLAFDLKVAGLRISSFVDTSSISPYPPFYPLCKIPCSYRKNKRIKSLYITAEGLIFGCPFLGDPPFAQLRFGINSIYCGVNPSEWTKS
jgi:MoaA/NifB/PqqE/SkfB family radical SAM enzyme